MKKKRLKSNPARPLFATPRNPRRRTRGGEVLAHAAAIGWTPMPWQEQVINVALECRRAPVTKANPDGWGTYYYDTVVVTVPRQSGKSRMVHAVTAWRAEQRSRQHFFYMAQNRISATEQVYELAAEWPGLVKVRRSVGSEKATWPNGTELAVVAPNAKSSAHGQTNAFGVVDEAWALEPHVMAAVVPTFAAVPDSQLWIISTAGVPGQSPVLENLVASGRDSVTNRRSNVAYFEWAMGDDPHADAYDPAVWRKVHPALGYTIDESALRSAASLLSPAEFMRSYMNRATPLDVSAVPLNWWTETEDILVPFPERDTARPASMVLAIDANFEPQGAAIAAAWDDGGSPHMALVEHRTGPMVNWLPERVEIYLERWAPAALVMDRRGPASSVIDDIKTIASGYGTQVLVADKLQVGQATVGLYERLETRTVTHGQAEPLDLAVGGAARQTYGELFYWARRRSTADVSPLAAVTLALHYHLKAKNRPAPQVFFVGDETKR